MIAGRAVLTTIFGMVASLSMRGRSWARALAFTADPVMRVQSWPFGEEPVGEWWACELKRSKSKEYVDEITSTFGKAYIEVLGAPTIKFRTWRELNFCQRESSMAGVKPADEYVAFGFAGNSPHVDKQDISEKEYLIKEAEIYNKRFMIGPTGRLILRVRLDDPEELFLAEAYERHHAVMTKQLKEKLLSICKWGA